MKYFVRIIDETGILIDETFVDELTELTIETPIPNGMYAVFGLTPKWENGAWVEVVSAPAPTTPEPTAEERLASVEAALTALMGV